MLYYNTKITSDGLIFSFDAANKKSTVVSREPTTNVFYDANTNTFLGTFATVDGPASTFLEIVSNSVYQITSTGISVNRLYFPVSAVSNNKTYTFSYKYETLSGKVSISDFCDRSFYNRKEENLFGSNSYFSGTSSRYAYDSTYRFIDFRFNSNTTIKIWDIQLENKEYPTEFVNGIRTSDSSNVSIYTNSVKTTNPNSIELFNSNYSTNNKGVLSFSGNKSFGITKNDYSYLNSSSLECVFKLKDYPAYSSNTFTIFGLPRSPGFSFASCGAIYFDNATKFVKGSVITAVQGYRSVSSTTTINLNQYYHIVLNKDTINGLLQLFVNGNLQSQISFDAASYAQWPTVGTYVGNNDLYFGRSLYYDDIQSTWACEMNGEIGIARMYNRVLTNKEVFNNYDSVKSRFNL